MLAGPEAKSDRGSPLLGPRLVAMIGFLATMPSSRTTCGPLRVRYHRLPQNQRPGLLLHIRWEAIGRTSMARTPGFGMGAVPCC